MLTQRKVIIMESVIWVFSIININHGDKETVIVVTMEWKSYQTKITLRGKP